MHHSENALSLLCYIKHSHSSYTCISDPLSHLQDQQATWSQSGVDVSKPAGYAICNGNMSRFFFFFVIYLFIYLFVLFYLFIFFSHTVLTLLCIHSSTVHYFPPLQFKKHDKQDQCVYKSSLFSVQFQLSSTNKQNTN